MCREVMQGGSVYLVSVFRDIMHIESVYFNEI